MPADRSKAPLIHPVSRIEIPKPHYYSLDNGIRVIEINKGTQEIVRIDVLYDAGRPVEDKALAARFAAILMREGTAHMTAEQLAERIDYFGGTLSSGSNMDFSYCSLFVLAKYLEDTLPYLSQVMYEAQFDAEEIEKYRINHHAKLKDQLAKSDLKAFRQITESMYGASHPYGYNSDEAKIDAISRADLLEHYERYHTPDRCQIIVSGKLPKDIRLWLNKHLGQAKRKHVEKPGLTDFLPIKADKILLPSEQTHQTAIKLGRRMFTRSHPDFASAFMMTTVLGGYFGSRLMTRIREELGYTYNIYASLDPLVYDGYLTINTEVSNDLADATVQEIRQEIIKLQEDKISHTELDMVKNYVMGNFLNLIDGPFRIANFMKTLSVSKLPLETYEHIIQQIRECSADQIMLAAQQYLQAEDMIEVRVGSQY